MALCRRGNAAPCLVARDGGWSRGEVLAWLDAEMPRDTLVGLDLGMALPFVDAGGYFPGWDRSPADACGLWALVDEICVPDPHYGASSFVDHAEAARHFRRHRGREGDRFLPGRGRLRVTEEVQAAMRLNPVSNLNLVGAAQVGKASLTGMRLLHRLNGRLPIWPFDSDPGHGAMLVEIYTGLIARDAGRPPGRSKMRDAASLNAALLTIGSQPTGLTGTLDDHSTDAILSAAWLRAVHARAELWHPASLSADVARTEGWTFGAC